jgi:hypothetical protein
VSGLKGQNMTAQGNALGFVTPKSVALKGNAVKDFLPRKVGLFKNCKI